MTTNEDSSKREKFVEECLELNEKAELKEVNSLLEAAGSEFVVTEKINWKPGDPVTNNAELMLQNEWEQEATEEEAKKVNPYLFRATDGVMRDMRYTAPERFPKDKKEEPNE